MARKQTVNPDGVEPFYYPAYSVTAFVTGGSSRYGKQSARVDGEYLFGTGYNHNAVRSRSSNLLDFSALSIGKRP
jgi:hypothetical protein